MRVCIPFRISDIGGGSMFAQKYTEALRGRGIEVTSDPAAKADIMLIMSSAPPADIRAAKARGTKVVQRLDGVFYYRVRGPLYPLWNYRMKAIHRGLADYVIYQSEFSRRLCQRFLGRTTAPSAIIYNGVDTQLFRPDGPARSFRSSPNQRVLFTIAAFRRLDMLQPLLAAMEHLQKRRSDIRLVVAGTIAPKLQPLVDRYRQVANVRFLGKVPNAELPSCARGADAFVFSDISACPNVVIEALACGLPVVCFRRGGTPELLDERCAEVVPHPDGEYWRLRPFDTAGFAAAVERLLAKGRAAKEAARARALAHYTLEVMVDRYLDVFQELV